MSEFTNDLPPGAPPLFNERGEPAPLPEKKDDGAAAAAAATAGAGAAAGPTPGAPTRAISRAAFCRALAEGAVAKIQPQK